MGRPVFTWNIKGEMRKKEYTCIHQYYECNFIYNSSASQECVSKKCYTSEEACNDYELPRTYIAYHLNGGRITMDGHLDDQAWKEVPWTESFLGKMFIYSRFTTWYSPKTGQIA